MIQIIQLFKFISTVGGIGAGAGTYVMAGIAVMTGLSGVLQIALPYFDGGITFIELIDIVTKVSESTAWMTLVGGLGLGRLRQGMEGN